MAFKWEETAWQLPDLHPVLQPNSIFDVTAKTWSGIQSLVADVYVQYTNRNLFFIKTTNPWKFTGPHEKPDKKEVAEEKNNKNHKTNNTNLTLIFFIGLIYMTEQWNLI